MESSYQHPNVLLTVEEAYSSQKNLEALGRIARTLQQEGKPYREAIQLIHDKADWESADRDSLRWMVSNGTVDELEVYIQTKILDKFN